MIRGSVFALVLLTLCFGPWRFADHAVAQEAFFKGKTVRLVVDSTPGGFYDRWARIFAKFMPKYIAGSPEIVVQTCPAPWNE